MQSTQPSFYPPEALAPYANLPVLSTCPAALTYYLADEFSVVELQQVESAKVNLHVSENLIDSFFNHVKIVVWLLMVLYTKL